MKKTFKIGDLVVNKLAESSSGNLNISEIASINEAYTKVTVIYKGFVFFADINNIRLPTTEELIKYKLQKIFIKTNA